MSELRDKVIEFLREHPERRFAVGLSVVEHEGDDCSCPVLALATRVGPPTFWFDTAPDIADVVDALNLGGVDADGEDVNDLMFDIDVATGARSYQTGNVFQRPSTRTGAEILAALGAA